jgi:hypothetical protein
MDGLTYPLHWPMVPSCPIMVIGGGAYWGKGSFLGADI